MSSYSPRTSLLAAVPHVLGFKPEESVVLVPFGPGLPITRVDLPTSAAAREGVWDAISGPYGRHARPGARLGILCFTEDRRSAEPGQPAPVQPTRDRGHHHPDPAVGRRGAVA
ncbi:DUF4192 family protein [Nocardioides sp. W3-2-3]|nr:DUF4192 family protein [Nocardioides convexus]